MKIGEEKQQFNYMQNLRTGEVKCRKFQDFKYLENSPLGTIELLQSCALDRTDTSEEKTGKSEFDKWMGGMKFAGTHVL